MERRIALAWLALLASIPLAGAQDAAPQPSFLVYHVTGGPGQDPLATALAQPPAADRLPATFFDRDERAQTAPENAPESAPAHFREMERRLSSRETMGAPVLVVSAELGSGAIAVTTVPGANGTLHLVLFEHGARLGGVPQPYVARFSTAPANATTGIPARETVRLDPAWDVGSLGVVAILRENGTVAQSATWLVGDAQVRQAAKGVLVEHLTASWCDPCAPADDALALLALQRGAGPALSAGEVAYFRPPSSLFYAGLALGGLAAIAIVRRREA